MRFWTICPVSGRTWSYEYWGGGFGDPPRFRTLWCEGLPYGNAVEMLWEDGQYRTGSLLFHSESLVQHHWRPLVVIPAQPTNSRASGPVGGAGRTGIRSI